MFNLELFFYYSRVPIRFTVIARREHLRPSFSPRYRRWRQ